MSPSFVVSIYRVIALLHPVLFPCCRIPPTMIVGAIVAHRESNLKPVPPALRILTQVVSKFSRHDRDILCFC